MKVVREYLDLAGLDYKDFGTFTHDYCDYPTVAAPAASAVADGVCDKGIFICGTGIGMSIFANKTQGIRAALCTTCYMAEMSRNHNDANVLVLGGRVIDNDTAVEMVKLFLSTSFSDKEKHHRRVEMLKELDMMRKH